MSIALFFLLSGFFLTVLLGAIEHSGRLLIVAGACLAAVVCIIVFLAPVELPRFHANSTSTTEAAAATTVPASAGGLAAGTSTTLPSRISPATYTSAPILTTESSSAAEQ